MKVHAGHGGLAVVVGFAGAIDVWLIYTGRKSLSETSYDLTKTKGGPLLIAAWVYLTLHLTRYLPVRYDIFRNAIYHQLRQNEQT